MREFATSEAMMIRQKATVPPIFNEVKFKQLQDQLDPFAVEFMLSLATDLQSRTHALY